MKKPIYILLLLVSIVSSCSTDDNSEDIKSVKIVFTEGEASKLKITPLDDEAFFEANEVREYEDVNQVSIDLPDYTNHFEVIVHGSQERITGYVEVNGEKMSFTAIDWYYSGTYYLEDF
ncbi:hypothetical protein KO493_03280 [Tamlana agarivorans]|uniref:Uncharacterized protein n=1 Tax=Pseudotamlana agarivorans TaxID=481183 RepID=A0ACC5U5Y7_9FLAO|nr:hypothetical protein [Tamlana agarivorans]MBU2949716.1 hypothetical protein [Tamlana agarivorans]